MQKLSKIFNTSNINWTEAIITPHGGFSLSFHFEIMPSKFLTYAENDLTLGNENNIINALANSKRAMMCVMDGLFDSLGLRPVRDNFPSRIKLLDEVGVLAPRILHKVNRIRNLMEHDYKMPTLEEVEEAFDISNLFVAAVMNSMNMFNSQFSIGIEQTLSGHNNQQDAEIFFSFDDDIKVWDVRLYGNKNAISTEVKCSDQKYKNIIKVCMSIDKDVSKQREAIINLIA